MPYRILPSNMRRAKKLGCELHGHVFAFKNEETVPLTNDPIYKEKVIRYYSCIHCPQQTEDESLVPRTGDDNNGMV